MTLSFSQRISVLTLVGILAQTLLAGDGSFVPKVGLTKEIPSVGAPERTFDLFIPASYEKDAAKKFPVLFVSSPNGNPNIKPYTTWAERQSVIVVGFNSSKNGPTDNNIQAQDAALKTIEPVLRLHDCLRFAVGMSGAAQASWVLATRFPDKFAGILMMGQSGFNNLPPKHIAVAYIYGDKEPNLKYIEDACQRLKRNGNPLKHLVIPGGHVAGSAEQQAVFLDWMLELSRLGHPKLSPADTAAAKKDVQSRLTEAGKLSDPKARKDELERLLGFPGVATWPESKPFISAWLSSAVEASAKMSGDVEKYILLSDVQENPWAVKAEAASKSALDKQLVELRKIPQVKTEYEADMAFKQCTAMEAQAGTKKGPLQTARQAYEALAQRFANTRSGKKATEAAARLAAAD